MSLGNETFLDGGQPIEFVAFEIGDATQEENVAVTAGSRTVSGVKSTFGSVDPEKTLTEFRLSELETKARARLEETGPCMKVGSISGFVRVPTVALFTAATIVKATRMKD